jgi:hypothetical protein
LVFVVAFFYILTRNTWTIARDTPNQDENEKKDANVEMQKQ